MGLAEEGKLVENEFAFYKKKAEYAVCVYVCVYVCVCKQI
jgi:hypothetical protein